MSHSFAIDNLRQFVEYTDNKNNQLAHIVMALNNEVMKLKKIVTKLKNGEEIDEDEDNTATTTVTSAPQMGPPRIAPQMTQHPQFAQMPQLQTLNLNSSHSITN